MIQLFRCKKKESSQAEGKIFLKISKRLNTPYAHMQTNILSRERESFSRQFVSLVPSSVSVCLTTAKKRAQRVNNGFHSLMLTKKIVHQTDVSCPFEPKYKQMTDKFTRDGANSFRSFFIWYILNFFSFLQNQRFLYYFVSCIVEKEKHSRAALWIFHSVFYFAPFFPLFCDPFTHFAKKFTDISQRLREIITHQ